MTDETINFDYIWKFAIKDQKTQRYHEQTLSKDDEKQFLNLLCNGENPKCLQRFLSASRKPAVANIKVQQAEFIDTSLKLIIEIKTKYIELLGQNDVKTCFYQCLKENNCGNIVLCSDDGTIIPPEDLLKGYEEQYQIQEDTGPNMEPSKVIVKDLVWDVNLKKRNGALVPVPDDKVPVLNDIFLNGLWHHANQSKSKHFKIHDIRFEKIEAVYKIIVSISRTVKGEILTTVINTIDKWIGSSLQNKGQKDVCFFYDEESELEREVSAKSIQPIYKDFPESQKSESRVLNKDGNQLPGNTLMGVKTPHQPESKEPQACAETVREHLEKVPEGSSHVNYFSIEWELIHKDSSLPNEEEMESCRESLKKCLNEELLKGTWQELLIANMCDIYVARTKLWIKFALRSETWNPDVEILGEVVQTCLNKNEQHKCSIKNGKISQGAEETGLPAQSPPPDQSLTKGTSSKPSSSNNADLDMDFDQTKSYHATKKNVGTDVDHPRTLSEENAPLTHLAIEWELKFKNDYSLFEHEVRNCRDALSAHVNEELLKSKVQDFFIADHQHDIQVTTDTLLMKFSMGKRSSIPDINALGDIIGKCLKKNNLGRISVKNGKTVTRIPGATSYKSNEIMVCLFLPEDLAKEIQSVTIWFHLDQHRSEELIKHGIMWRKQIVIPDYLDGIEYKYCLKIKKSVVYFFSTVDKVWDLHRRRINSLDYIQRDIISIMTKPFQEKDKVGGIVAHLEDILEGLQDEHTAFRDLDNLVTRNTANLSNWNKAFENLFEGKISKMKCFFLLHCIQKGFVTEHTALTRNIAPKVWRQLQHLEKESNEMCVQFFEEIFEIFKASSASTNYLLHFIKEGRFFLDISALHKRLPSEPPRRFICDCPNRLLCLRDAMQIILNQDADRQMLQDIIQKILSYIPAKNDIDVLMIVKEITPSDQNKELTEMVQKHVFTNLETKLTEQIKSSFYKNATKEIISKAEGDLKLMLISHCEKEILFFLRKNGNVRNFLSELECLCNEHILFQATQQQLLLLDVLLKMPGIRSRNMIKYVLMNIESTDSKCEMEILEEAFEVLLETATVDDVMETFMEFDVLSGKQFFQARRKNFEKSLESYTSKVVPSCLLKIHKDIEKLHNSVIEFYCQVLEKRLRSQTFHSKCKFIEGSGSDILTRGKASIFISSLESCGITQDSPDEEVFHHAIENVLFWKTILGVKGKHNLMIRQHPLFVLMKDTYKKMYTDLQNDMYDYSVLQKFQLEMEKEKNIYDVFCLVVEDSKSAIRKTMTRAFDFLKRACKEIELMISVLLRVSSKLPGDFCEGLNGSVKFLKEIMVKLNNGQMRFCDFRNLQIFENRETWKEQSLLQSCKDLEDFLSIQSFWKSIDSFFQYEMKDVLEERKQRTGELSCEQQTKMVIGFLASNCISKFRERMKNVWEGDISIQQLYHLFWQKNFMVNNLSEEFDRIEKRIGFTKLSCDRESTIRRCLDLKLNSEKILALKKFQSAICSKLDEKYERQIRDFEEIYYCHAESKLSMQDADNLIRDMESSVISFSEEVMGVIIEFSNSENLVHFLREIMSEDIRNLMDAVEGEYFDQYLPLVSHLVEVKELLLPVLKLAKGTDTTTYTTQIEASLKKTEIQKAAVKISQCSKDLDSLKNFYKAFANKSEKTKDRIENILDKGEFKFKLTDDECTLEIHCSDGTKHTASDLSDLRSRALLIQNRFEKKCVQNTSFHVTQGFSEFLKKVDAATEILETYQQLKILGHPLFVEVKTTVQMSDLEETKANLTKKCEEWKEDLKEFRQKFSCLKYIKSEQLQLFFHFINRKKEDKHVMNNHDVVQSVLWYLHPNLNWTLVEENDVLCNESPRCYLEMIVRCLENEFRSLAFKGKPFPPSIRADLSTFTFTKQINFLCMDKDSEMSVNLIFGLFQMKCDRLPLPSEVVLCNENTSWDEIYLLLLRCRSENNVSNQCFCIAFLEQLPFDYQGMLIDEIEKSEWNNGSLVLIYRGRPTDSIPTLFKDCEIFIKPLDKMQMEFLLQTLFPNVVVFTSDSPGVGKTEEIRDMAASQERGVKSLHVSGGNQRSQLIQRLMKLDLKPYEILHIEIGLTDKPEELDVFLFELLILRYVSHSSLSYVLPETVVAIEITNCPNQMMMEMLPFLMCFSRRHLKWKDYDNYKCQQVLNSPVQVVSAYLQKLENEDISADIDLSRFDLLSEDVCKKLLRKYFPSFDGINFSIVNVFVSVLSSQLKKLSSSTYFQHKNLSLMIGEENIIPVRKVIVESLVQFSKEFASRSIASCRDSQHRTFDKFYSPESGLKLAVMNLAMRTKGMIRWENSNHLVVMFHSHDTQTVSAVYRSLENVPHNIKNMFQSQIKNDLPDYASMESDQILDVIVRIARTKKKHLSKEKLSTLASGYAYTPDNMLKMMVIALRIQSNIPVVIMGETGCGKTSLIRRLAQICDVHLEILSVHAGLEEKDILGAVHKTNNLAISNRAEVVWMFFDELNTSEDVGLISEIVCHRKLHGKELSPNLSFIAACNPYRLRDSHHKFTKGLQGKLSEDALSMLAYRVHPLPEMMLDFVWDYGSLPLQEERAYIQRMVKSGSFKIHGDVLIQLLGASQQFVREKEGSSCTVSLRDVNRCIQLIKWFKDQFIPKQHPEMEEGEVYLRSFILGLTICYLCRFSNSEDRLAYRERLTAVFSSNFIDAYSEKKIARCVREEHNAILDKMDIPRGTARNTALSENIFVMLVCILNRLPLFIVGKPGCSKSLSMQLIRNNMRGKDSKDAFFQNFPRLFYSSFQGSESSTSDGIIKVFERAKKFEKQDRDVLSLVILDEIGLAEISRFNPLKVLHSLLEPEGKDRPEVAVVGISNWTLDSAKMNRAIHLSRPDMNEEELFITGQSIMDSIVDQSALESILRDVAKAYLDYTEQQPIRNFHGLRDYYSFVKYISRKFEELENSVESNDLSDNKNMSLLNGLLRNFGGQQMNNDTMKKTFFNRLSLDDLPVTETKELIKENIVDSEARHLMLIVDGDSALGSIENIIQNLGKDLTTILGSKFSDDQDDEYNYRILNRIILCMEQPQVLILKDLDDIYGSLYDMLNQNYTIVQGKKHCRVALGPFSNPTCEVNSEFKCIVIIDESNVTNTDPPFLNRFEKQQYFLRDILKPKYVKVALGLEAFVQDLLTYRQTNTLFCPEDAFPIAGRDMFSSLVALVEQKLENMFRKSITETQVIFFCITELLWILKPDCFLRADISSAYDKSPKSVQYLLAEYMTLPVHNGLKYYLQEMCLVEEHALLHQNSDNENHEKEMLSFVPFELKELMDNYFGETEDDDSVFEELLEHSEHKEQDDFDFLGPFEKDENLECSADSSDEYLEKDDDSSNRRAIMRNDVKRQRLHLLRTGDGFGAKFVIFTYSTVYCKIQNDISELDGSLYKLSEYKSEKTFTKDVETFFESSQRKLFVLQCDLKSDYHHILLAKSVLENTKKRSIRSDAIKHVCIVIHMTRSSCPFQMFNKINFSTGWTIATLDSLEKPAFTLPDLYNKPVLDVLKAKEQEFGELIVKELPWASAKIQYQGISTTITDVKELKNSTCAIQFLSEQIQSWIKRHSDTEDNMDWQHKAAFDKHLLETSTTMIGTLESHLSSLIHEPLARIMFAVEKAGIMGCLLTLDELKPDLKYLLHKGCECKDLYDIDAVPPPTGPGCYIINVVSQMKVPFSKLMFDNFEKYRAEVLEDVRRANIIPGTIQVVEDQELKSTMLAIARTYSDMIRKETFLLDLLTFECIEDDLRNDFYLLTTSTINCHLNEEEKVGVMTWIFAYLIENINFPDAPTFLMTLNLWTWIYFKNISGIFHLLDSWKTRNGCENVLSIILPRSEKETTLLGSLQSLVDSICEEMLYRCEKLDLVGMQSWQEDVYKLMAIIGEIGVTSHKTETLKFFTDFISVVFLPSKCHSTHLNEFAICVSHCEWNLTKHEVFQTLWYHLKLMNKYVNSLKLQQIACSYIARCNGFCVDDDLELQQINLEVLNLIKKGEMFDENFRFYGHCLKLSLLDYLPETNEEFEDHLFLNMLENECSDELGEYLEKLDNVLKSERMSLFSALFISTLEEEAFSDAIASDKIAAIATHNDFLVRKMLQADDVLKTHNHGLRYCVAVAFLRKFLSVTASLFSVSFRNGHLFTAIDKLLCRGTEIKEQREMQKYFIDCIKRNVGDLELFRISMELSETMQFFKTSTMLPVAENVTCSVMSLNLARYCNMSDLLFLLSMDDISKEHSFLERFVEGEKMLTASLLCVLHNRVYYTEGFSKVADSDNLFGKSVEKCSASFEDEKMKILIRHLVNQHACSRNILKQSGNKPPDTTSLTTFLFHLISLILINKTKTSVLYKAAIYHEIPECTVYMEEPLTSFKIRNCACGHRITTEENVHCPWCSSSSVNGPAIAVKKPLKQQPFSAIVRDILIDAALVTSCLFQDLVSEVGIKEVESREKGLEMNWKRLRDYLQVNDWEECQLLMIFLENAQELFSDSNISKSSWNPKYDTELSKVFMNRYQQIRNDNDRHIALCAKLKSASKNNLEDVATIDSLFCLQEKPSIENLYLELHVSRTEEKFPCLRMILENLELLSFPQYIDGILQWHRLLITKCSYSLKKVDCNYMSAGSFINQQNKEIQRDLRESFKIFCDTWEKLVSLIPSLEHHSTKLPRVEKINEDSTMDLCVLKNKTSVVFQVLNALCSIQNTLLDKALGTCILYENKALGFLQLEPRQAAVASVPLMDLQTKQIIRSISVDETEQQALFSQCKCIGETRGIEYDFRKIEIEWAFKIFHNKVHILIDETMMFMEFKDDLYGHCVQLLQKVSALIPQTRIDSTTEAKIKERLDNDPSQVPQLLTIIGTITTIICRRKTTEGGVHIADFAGKLEKLQLLGLSNNCLLSYIEFDLTLNKVVAFYTILEEINGEKYFNALDTELRDAMQDRTKKQITSVISGRITLLKACESAMHVFLHRHLYIRNNDISLQQPLADYLASPELWKDAHILNQRISIPEIEFEILLQDVFPLDLLIKHVYKFLELLKEQIKVHQTKTQIPKMTRASGKQNKRRALAGVF